jgi:hypothetical protein
MKKIKQKDIDKNMKQAEELKNSMASKEEKVDYIKYIALQVVLGTLLLIAMMIVLYMLQLDTKHILTIIIAYFPYLYIKREAPRNLHVVIWAIYIVTIIFGLFR